MANKVFIDNILDPATGDQGFFLGMNTDNGYPGMAIRPPAIPMTHPPLPSHSMRPPPLARTTSP